MKVRIEQDELKGAVAWAARTLPSRATHAAHASIRVEAEGHMVRLTTFDSETATKAEVDAVVDEPGVAMVNGKLLADIVKELPRQPVEAVLEGSRLAIRCGRSDFGLPTLPASEFASAPQLPTARGTVEGKAFAEAITQVQIAASKDDLLPPLTGIRVEFRETSIAMVATDRYRLALRRINWVPAPGGLELDALVKARQLSDLAHSVDPTAAVTVAVGGESENLIGFSAEGRELVTRLMHGDFPDYRRLLPDVFSSTVSVETEELVGAVKRVKIVNQGKNNPIRLSFSDGEVLLRASGSGEDASALESLECGIDGDNIEIAFNPDYLVEGLNAAKSPKVTLAFNGPQRAAIIRPHGENVAEYQYLLMPMRFQ